MQKNYGVLQEQWDIHDFTQLHMVLEAFTVLIV